MSFWPVPHPSGIAVDSREGIVHIASTRNPNQIYDLAPVSQLADRGDAACRHAPGRPLVPLRSRFLPGCLYIHDLAMVGGTLHANAVGQNAIIRLAEGLGHERVWWPRCIDRAGGPAFGPNYLQLNSIAAGKSLSESFFSASTDRPGTRRPGHRNFAVDARGVIFSGATREPVAHGLTRPHSARVYRGKLWVDNSGYGEIGFIEDRHLRVVARLPGWTRGLCFCQDIAFVGTSRVIPRFRHYAPGLRHDKSQCGVWALDLNTGQVVGSITWPYGNQIFAVEVLPSSFTTGLPFTTPPARCKRRSAALFYAFQPPSRWSAGGGRGVME